MQSKFITQNMKSQSKGVQYVYIDSIMVSNFVVRSVSSSCILEDTKLPQVTLRLGGNVKIRSTLEVMIFVCSVSLILDLN